MSNQSPKYCLEHNTPFIDGKCPFCDDPLEEAAKTLKPSPNRAVDQAVKGIYGAKNDSYGPAHVEFDKMSQIDHIVWGGEKKGAVGHALYMIILKILREVNCHKQDNFTDIIGYAQLADDAHDNE